MKIIQIGSNDGLGDDTRRFIEQNRDKIELAVLIEPLPFVFEKLKQNYKGFSNIFFENIGILDKSGEMDIHYEDGSPNFQLSSFNLDHVLGHHPHSKDVMKTVSVQVLTFEHLMEKYGIFELDNLWIDAEGLDAVIIESIDFNKYKIKEIFFEYRHLDGIHCGRGPKTEKLIQYLGGFGYKVEMVDKFNMRGRL